MYDKGTVFYVVREEGQADRVLLSENEAIAAFKEPCLGVRKNVIKCQVIAQKVLVTTEQEVE